MASLPKTLVLLAVFVILGRWLLSRPASGRQEMLFGLLNVIGVYGLFFQGGGFKSNLVFLIYLALVVWQFLMLRWFAQRPGAEPWLAFFAPLLVLLAIRYGTPFLPADWQQTQPLAGYFVGISYLAFRSSHLVVQLRNGVAARPGFWKYLGFCFFVPTLQAGPISHYSVYDQAFRGEPSRIPVCRAGLRILIGAIKYQFLGVVCDQLSYSSLLLDYHQHPWMDLPIAMVFYYLFLYCNFSGFCDMAIGMSGLIGIPVQENFDNPMAARNMKDFWNRWHITLSQWMRDIVFAPLSKFLVRLMGPPTANHAIAITITVVFLLVGIWHGTGWNFVLFGTAQALGVVTVHYYTIGLKKWLGREGFKAYNENRLIHAVAVGMTFAYFSVTTLFFANTLPQIKAIFYTLR